MSSISHSNRPYDLILYGATGFTGQYAFQLLCQKWIQNQGNPSFSIKKWAIAGRNLKKLNALAQSLKDMDCTVFVADAHDREALNTLCQQTRLIVSTAGPFALYSDLLVELCVENGTHYLDLTGETPWIKSLIDRFHLSAQENQALIIPACGFDSVPSDLGVWALWKLSQKQNQPLQEVDTCFSLRGGLNGGTLASALTLAESGQNRVMAKRMLLCPQDHESLPTLGPLHSLSSQPRDPRSLDFDSLRQAWKLPFFMGQINTRVVRRSACFLGYGDAFQYLEWMKVSSKKQGTLIGLGLAIFERLIRSKWGRILLRTLGPNPGQGPSEERVQNGWMKMHLINRSAQKELQSLTIKAQGDPGNAITVQCLIACAQTLLEMEHPRSGVLTPAVGLGESLWRRLLSEGWSLSTKGEIVSWDDLID